MKGAFEGIHSFVLLLNKQLVIIALFQLAGLADFHLHNHIRVCSEEVSEDTACKSKGEGLVMRVAG